LTCDHTLILMTDANRPLNAAVIGCGRMGKLHARVYAQLPGVKLVGVVDGDADFASAAAQIYHTQAFATVEELLGHHKVDLATVAVPTTSHVAAALPLIEKGVSVLVEKPLAGSVSECEQLVAAAKRAGVVTMVGHIERFNPAVRSLRDLGIRPGFIEVTRISPLTFRSIDVGVVLDMMIHDIDIVLSLAQSEVVEVSSTGVRVLSEAAEDVANARIKFASGCVANLTASRLAMKTERKLRVFSSDAYVSLDYQKKQGMVIRKGKNLQAIRDVVDQIRAGTIDDISQIDYAELVEMQELSIDDVEPIRAELESFVGAVRGQHASEVPFEDGLKAVALAQQIVAGVPASIV
jgi:predicted dehydrogenase